MSAKWKIGTVDVFVSEEEIGREVKRAELFVLDAQESTWHTFGAGSEKRMIKGTVIGDANKNAIIAYAIGDTAFSFTTPWETVAGMKINGTPKFSAVKYNSGTFDGVTYDVGATPIYECDLEVIQS